jgi:uncharacterized LabA/DUF88 family protein
MRVALFFDGKNFYENLEQSYTGRHHLNYRTLANWLVERVGGGRMTGAHYYTGIPDHLDPDSPEYIQLRGLIRFLDGLEYVEGFFVYRFPRVRRMHRCGSCGVSSTYTEEKEVDTTMVADMIRLAADDAFDALILASGDADHAPAVEAVRAMGKVVYLASWGDEAMSPRLRRAAFGHIDLLNECPKEILGVRMKATIDGDEDALAAVGDSLEIPMTPEDLEKVLEEIIRAQSYFEEHGGYLGRGYFIHRWRGIDIPQDIEIREVMLDHLVETNLVEEIQILGETALRTNGDAEATRPLPETKVILQPPQRGAASSFGNMSDTIPYIPVLSPDIMDTGSRTAVATKKQPEWMEKLVKEKILPDEEMSAAWDSIQRAEIHFEHRGFVGRGYFLTKWRDPTLPQEVAHRERLLTGLIEIGVVEQYSVDGTTALRTAKVPIDDDEQKVAS